MWSYGIVSSLWSRGNDDDDDDESPCLIEQIVVTSTLLLVTLLLLSSSPRSSIRKLGEKLFSLLLLRRKPPPKVDRRSRNPSWKKSSHHRFNLLAATDKQQTIENDILQAEFEKAWPRIRLSSYRKLVLPPECKRVVVGKGVKRVKEDGRGDVRRLEAAALLGFLDGMLECLTTVWNRFIPWSRSRKVVGENEGDDEEDDSSASTTVTANTTTRHTSKSSEHENHAPPFLSSEEKKDGFIEDSSVESSISPRSFTRKSTSQHPHISTIFAPPSSSSSSEMKFFDAEKSFSAIKKLSRDLPVPDRNGYILGDEFLDSKSATPLLVFVNSRSGPQQGHVLIHQLRRLLNPIQVWDLAAFTDGDDFDAILQSFRVLTKWRILVCGGDGTVSWIISALEKAEIDPWPPIAILPLGTGNDLARVHGWGGGYSNESSLMILEQIRDSYVSLLDRWDLTIEGKKGRIKTQKEFTNYLGVGVDARAALQVHMLRESKPKLFFSRAVNKAWYALFGAEDVIKASCAGLPQKITLIADGVEIPLPPDSQGIIFLNIDSYSGGVPLWALGERYYHKHNKKSLRRIFSSNDLRFAEGYGLTYPMSNRRQSSTSIDRIDSSDSLDLLDSTNTTPEQKLKTLTACNNPSSCQDGMLDVVSIRGTFHLGQIRVGLSNAQLICQCREASITTKTQMAVHVDGESWKQSACVLKIRRKENSAIMLHRAGEEGGGVEAEVASLLDWARERKVIDRKIHDTLMKEFSRRIENKTRQRRVRSQDNLMLSLKRALVKNPSS